MKEILDMTVGNVSIHLDINRHLLSKNVTINPYKTLILLVV